MWGPTLAPLCTGTLSSGSPSIQGPLAGNIWSPRLRPELFQEPTLDFHAEKEKSRHVVNTSDKPTVQTCSLEDHNWCRHLVAGYLSMYGG